MENAAHVRIRDLHMTSISNTHTHALISIRAHIHRENGREKHTHTDIHTGISSIPSTGIEKEGVSPGTETKRELNYWTSFCLISSRNLFTVIDLIVSVFKSKV